MYKQGKAKAIGVSNYCVSCFDCLLNQPGVTVVPAVNQVQYHVGMGDDPHGLLSFCAKKGIVIQAYSPVGACCGPGTASTNSVVYSLATASSSLTTR